MAEELQKVEELTPSLSVDNRLQEAKRLVEQVDLFENIVSHSYLQSLSDCEVVEYQESDLTTMRWYEITKIVMEKNVFFPDKLSMLYMSLHSVAKNVVLIVDKSLDSKIRLFIGARDFEGTSNISGEILKAGLDGYLSGVKTKNFTSGHPGNVFAKPFVSSVSGVASLRDDKKESFVQGIEKLINATSNIPKFTAYFVADNVSDTEAKSIISAYNDLHNHISPFAESQVTMSENTTEGVSESLTENFSKSIAKSLSHTITHTEGFSESTTSTSGTSESKTSNFSNGYSSPGIVSFFVGAYSYNHSRSKTKTTQESTSIQKGSNSSDAQAEQTGETNTDQHGEAKMQGTNRSTTTGSTRQVTFKNNYAKFYLEILDEQIKRIKKGIPFGLWSTAAYFVAADKTTSKTLANLYRGCVVGESSNVESFAVNAWEEHSDNKEIVKYLDNSIQPRFYYHGINVSASSVVTSEELAIHLSLPQSSIPGLLVREEESFGRNIISETPLTEDNSIEIGVIRHLGVDYKDETVRLGVNGLSKHTFVTGTTGSGKSNSLYGLISQLADRKVDCSKHPQFENDEIKFLIIEPAKGEYKEVFGKRDGVTVYGSNPKVSKLLTLNPFIFPEDIDIYEHIDALVEIFNACWPMYAAMPQVLKHSIIEAYKSCGWDLVRSFNPEGIYPTIADVLDSLKEYINASEYSADTKGDYKGSLETRLQSLCDGIVGRMFNADPIPDELLFNQNVIIDLSRVKSSETKSLLMGLLVLKLNEFRASEHKGMNLPLRHITVLEEAHNLLKRTSTEQSSEGSNVAGMAVEKIANSMAEMRTYGEGFIIADQSPAMLDLSAIRNTNTKIVMALPEKDDREISGKALGLDDKHIEELSRLKTGEAIVYQTGWEEPVKSIINLFDIDSEPWSYQPSACVNSNNRENIAQEIFLTLADFYEGVTSTIDIQKFLNTLIEFDVSGGRLYTIIEKINSIDEVTSDDVAFIFATIIGTGIFDAAKSIQDFNIFNSHIIRGLNNFAGLENEPRSMTFSNMYLKGCSIKLASNFYETWLNESLKSNL